MLKPYYRNKISISISISVSESVSEWQGHLLSCSGQLKKERKWKTLVTTADPARRAVVQRQAMCNTLRLQGRITATSRYFSSLWTDLMFSNIAPDRGLCHKTLLFKTMKTHHWVLSLHRIFFQECIDTAPHWYWKNCPSQRSFHLVLGWSLTHPLNLPSGGQWQSSGRC